MQLRVAIPADASRIAEIHVETWRIAYRGQMPDTVLDALDVDRRAEAWSERLSQSPGQTFVAESNAGIIGFCTLMPSRDQDVNSKEIAEIAAIYVHPNHWHQGAGRALCLRALQEADCSGYLAVTLWVLDSNVAAKDFYTAMGFTLDGAAKIVNHPEGHELHEVRFRINR